MESLEDLEKIVKCNAFKYVVPKNFDKSFDFIKSIEKTKNAKVRIHPDWDWDGIASTKIVYNFMLEYIGRDKVSVAFGSSKSHGVDNETVQSILNDNITHLIIVDSSSNNIDVLNIISKMGVKILILDHHLPNYSLKEYPINCTIINTKMNGNEEIYEISAGFLCYIVTTLWRHKLSMSLKPSDFLLGYSSLISDGCNLKDDYIKPIILGAHKIKDIPMEMKLFMDKYSTIGKRFIAFNFVNIVNNLCRMNDSELIMNLFFRENTLDDLMSFVKLAKEKHRINRDLVNALCEKYLMFSEDLGSCMWVDLDKAVPMTILNEDFIVNATGLFGNRIAKQSGKPVIAIKSESKNKYKASGRTPEGYFPFDKICKVFDLEGGGHPGAFGFKFYNFDMIRIKNYCKEMAGIEAHEQFSVLDLDDYSNLMIPRIFRVISQINEIASGELKPVKIRAVLEPRFKIREYGKVREYRSTNLSIKDLKKETKVGDTVLGQPESRDTSVLLITDILE